MDSAAPVVDPLTVGRAFVIQYYHVLYNMPEHLHRFYQDISKVGRVGQNGLMREFSTLKGISEELITPSYSDFRSAVITSYDTQESYNGGFILMVTGYFTLNERLKRKFTQTFFLAPQENGYFVLNDILRFVNEPEPVDGEAVSVKDSEPPSLFNAPTDNKGSEQATCNSVIHVCKEVSKPMNNENTSVVEEEALDNNITRKGAADDSVKAFVPDDELEDVPKKSYASVLKVTNDASSLPPNPIAKVQEHQASSYPFPEQIPNDQGPQASSDLSPVIESDGVSELTGHKAVRDGTSVYVKHLPGNATIDMLETEFKQFGAISNGGIQVVNQWGFGFPFGFVEFENADSAQKAIEASPMMIGGQRAYIEEKRSTSRGNKGSGNVVGVRGGYGYNYRRGGRGGRFSNRRGNESFARINTY